MSVKPILFNTEMVKAILDGRKTQTRRVVKFKKGQNPKWTGYVPDGDVLYGSNNIPAVKAPLRKDDVLWVRETWGIQSAHRFECDAKIVYKAGGDLQKIQFSNRDDYDRFVWNKYIGNGKWYPSIHMPREAARIFLRVTHVRAERLQTITEEDAKAEGTCKAYPYTDLETGKTAYMHDENATYIGGFVCVWDSTIPKHPNKFKRYPYYWNDNPWVWVISFERCEKPKEWDNVQQSK